MECMNFSQFTVRSFIWSVYVICVVCVFLQRYINCITQSTTALFSVYWSCVVCVCFSSATLIVLPFVYHPIDDCTVLCVLELCCVCVFLQCYFDCIAFCVSPNRRLHCSLCIGAVLCVCVSPVLLWLYCLLCITQSKAVLLSVCWSCVVCVCFSSSLLVLPFAYPPINGCAVICVFELCSVCVFFSSATCLAFCVSPYQWLCCYQCHNLRCENCVRMLLASVLLCLHLPLFLCNGYWFGCGHSSTFCSICERFIVFLIAVVMSF